MTFCNPAPIAQACYLSRDVVNAAHEAFAKAVSDLADLTYSL
jgi:hypothetical protein